MIVMITITAAPAVPAIIPTGEDEELVGEEILGDAVGCTVTITQSSESNESSIAGQLESMSRVMEAIFIDGENCTQFVISLTTSSAVITEVESCTVTFALNTTVFTKFPFDSRQLKLSSTILNVQEHLDVIACITSDLMSSSFCFWFSFYNYCIK